MVLPSENSPPFYRYGFPQFHIVNNGVLTFAHIRKSTGLATVHGEENTFNPDIPRYGPYINVAASLAVFDMALILSGNPNYDANFRPLAELLLAVVRRGTAHGPPAEPLVLMAYGGCLMDALALFIKSNCNFDYFVKEWNFMQRAFTRAAQSLQNDFQENMQRHLNLLVSLRNHVFKAYIENSWRDDVSPQFLKLISLDLRSLSSQGEISIQGLIEGNATEERRNEDMGSEGESEMEEYEYEESLNECFEVPDCCHSYSGQSSVTYRLRWLCKTDHGEEGWKEETHGPFAIMTGDYASRIHAEVSKIFGFATEFESIRCDARYMAPTFVVGSCLHQREPQLDPTWQEIPMASDGQERDD